MVRKTRRSHRNSSRSASLALPPRFFLSAPASQKTHSEKLAGVRSRKAFCSGSRLACFLFISFASAGSPSPERFDCTSPREQTKLARHFPGGGVYESAHGNSGGCFDDRRIHCSESKFTSGAAEHAQGDQPAGQNNLCSIQRCDSFGEYSLPGRPNRARQGWKGAGEDRGRNQAAA